MEGKVEKVSREETAAYWTRRPPGSQASAAASDQSDPVPSKDTVEAKVTPHDCPPHRSTSSKRKEDPLKISEVKAKYTEKGEPIPLPDFWSHPHPP